MRLAVEGEACLTAGVSVYARPRLRTALNLRSPGGRIPLPCQLTVE